jgi:hypothetical protein
MRPCRMGTDQAPPVSSLHGEETRAKPCASCAGSKQARREPVDRPPRRLVHGRPARWAGWGCWEPASFGRKRCRLQRPHTRGTAWRSFLLCRLSPCWLAARVTAALIPSGDQTEHKLALVLRSACYYFPGVRRGMVPRPAKKEIRNTHHQSTRRVRDSLLAPVLANAAPKSIEQTATQQLFEYQAGR